MVIGIELRANLNPLGHQHITLENRLADPVEARLQGVEIPCRPSPKASSVEPKLRSARASGRFPAPPRWKTCRAKSRISGAARRPPHRCKTTPSAGNPSKTPGNRPPPARDAAFDGAEGAQRPAGPQDRRPMEDARRAVRRSVRSVRQITRHIEETGRLVRPLEVPPEIHEFPRLVARRGGGGDAEEGVRRPPDVS
jgi:hypothetical protein